MVIFNFSNFINKEKTITGQSDKLPSIQSKFLKLGKLKIKHCEFYFVLKGMRKSEVNTKGQMSAMLKTKRKLGLCEERC